MFFLALHIVALLLDIALIQFGVVVDLLNSSSQIVFGEFGLGSLLQLFAFDDRYLLIADLIIIVLLSVLIAGLLARMRWAWVATMFLIGASLLVSILGYFNGEPRYVNMLIGVLVVFYLNERSVRQVYEQKIEGEGGRTL